MDSEVAMCMGGRGLLFSRLHSQLLISFRNYCLIAEFNGKVFGVSQFSVLLTCGLRWYIHFLGLP